MSHRLIFFCAIGVIVGLSNASFVVFGLNSSFKVVPGSTYICKGYRECFTDYLYTYSEDYGIMYSCMAPNVRGCFINRIKQDSVNGPYNSFGIDVNYNMIEGTNVSSLSYARLVNLQCIYMCTIEKMSWFCIKDPIQ
jgi:hypothetical protein